MGADGGTIPKRCELVRRKKKKEKVDKNVENANKWRTCQSTQEPLKKPIVACKLGRLYNKEAILEAKIAKKLASNESTMHIKSLSDVKGLNLTENREHLDQGPEKGDTYVDYNNTSFVCPVTGSPMNGTNAFFVNWLCGCVLSEKAILEVKSDTCHKCGGPVDPEKMIKLYPDEELLEVYKQRIVDESAAKKAEKCAKKLSTDVDTEKTQIVGANGKKATKDQMKIKTEQNGLMGGQKRKAENGAEHSLQDNPSLPKSVKSMFTTSEEAKKRPQGHWVTHNPLYY